MKKWREDEIVRLRELFPNVQNSSISIIMGRSARSIEGMARRLRLVKTSEHIKKATRQTQFIKGYVPFNKGLKSCAYLDRAKYDKMIRVGIQNLNRGTPRVAGWNKRKVACISTDGGYRYFESASEAARALNISASLIGRVCRGTRKTAGGYIWKYAGDFTPPKAFDAHPNTDCMRHLLFSKKFTRLIGSGRSSNRN